MNILIINPIIYTAENKHIPRVTSIKDAMIYDLCLAFHRQGHRVTLYAAMDYKPTVEEEYPFPIIWDTCFSKKIFSPHRFPVLQNLRRYLIQNKNVIDLVITSEIFSVNSLIAYHVLPKKTIVWHELAQHNRMCHGILSRLWYNIVARFFMARVNVVARSNDAKLFIGQYCKNVHDNVIDHGVNIEKFHACREKQNHFVVCSQLIHRKKIDGILEKFEQYVIKHNTQAILYIIGSGELEEHLHKKAKESRVASAIIFKGKLNHDDMMPLLSSAQALLVNTEQDNNMISIVEAIAVGTPVLTTDVPLNSEYIIKEELGLAKQQWNEEDMHEIVQNNEKYVENCLAYRKQLSTDYRVQQLITEGRNII